MIVGKIAYAASSGSIKKFSTQEELNTYLETPKAKVGQLVELLERNKLGQNVYQVYVLQSINNVLVPQKISSDTDFSDLDLKIVDDENDEDKKYLVLGDDSDDETEYARVLLPAMGGAAMGGGGGSYIVMRLRNLLPSTIFTVPYNQETVCTCELGYTWSSVDTGDNNTPTGNGTAYYYVDGILVLTTQNLAQGNVVVNLGEYLTPNRVNVIKVIVVDSDNNKKSLTYHVNITIDSNNKLSSDLVDDANRTNKFVTSQEKTGWDSKYSKPNGGIPKSDLDSSVQDSLGKADTALQSYTEQYTGTVIGVTMNGNSLSPTDGVIDLGAVITAHQDISGKADKATTLAGYGITDGETTSHKVTAVNSSASDTQYPSAKAVYDAIQTAIGTIETQLSQVQEAKE